MKNQFIGAMLGKGAKSTRKVYTHRFEPSPSAFGIESLSIPFSAVRYLSYGHDFCMVRVYMKDGFGRSGTVEFGPFDSRDQAKKSMKGKLHRGAIVTVTKSV